MGDPQMTLYFQCFACARLYESLDEMVSCARSHDQVPLFVSFEWMHKREIGRSYAQDGTTRERNRTESAERPSFCPNCGARLPGGSHGAQSFGEPGGDGEITG